MDLARIEAPCALLGASVGSSDVETQSADLTKLDRAILTALTRSSRGGGTSEIGNAMVSRGLARSISESWRALDDLMVRGLVGREMGKEWVITAAGREAERGATSAED